MTRQCPSCGLQEPLVRFEKQRKDCIRCKRLRSTCKDLNIQVSDYNRMFEEQKGCCAICKRHQTEFKKALAIDHDHETGQVRGLLCMFCNTALGKFYDNEDNLRSAIVYLRNAAGRFQDIPSGSVESVGTTISD